MNDQNEPRDALRGSTVETDARELSPLRGGGYSRPTKLFRKKNLSNLHKGEIVVTTNMWALYAEQYARHNRVCIAQSRTRRAYTIGVRVRGSARHPRRVAHGLHQLRYLLRAVLGVRAFREERPGQMLGARCLRGRRGRGVRSTSLTYSLTYLLPAIIIRLILPCESRL